MTLTAEEQAIYDGKKGDVLQKAIKTVVAYGQLFGADKLVDLGGAPHHAVSWGSDGLEPLLKIYKQLADAGLKTYAPFTADPKPMDPVHLPVTKAEQAAVDKIYDRMDELEELNMKLGNAEQERLELRLLPARDGQHTEAAATILAWSESSAINYVELGARCPHQPQTRWASTCSATSSARRRDFGLLTDEGRQAVWLIEVKTTKLPHPEMIGSAIGLKVMEDVSYITGMDRFIKGVDDQSSGYLKDLGAATASNGAVGLYHMEGVTPEAVEKGRALLNKGYQTYVIDDAELDRIYASYPESLEGQARHAAAGVPGMSPHDPRSDDRMGPAHRRRHGESRAKTRSAVRPTCSARSTSRTPSRRRIRRWRRSSRATGFRFRSTVPMMWCSTPVEGAELVATNSNKTRVYTTARFFFDDALTELIVTGKLPANVA